MALLAETFVQADVACQVLVISIHLEILLELAWNSSNSLELSDEFYAGLNIGSIQITSEVVIKNIHGHLLTQLVDKLVKAEIHFRLDFIKKKSLSRR